MTRRARGSYCACKEGKLHKYGCDHEECPFCHEQLIGCDCCYKLLGVNPNEEPVFSKGLNTKQEGRWKKKLREKGRIPGGSEISYKASEIWTSQERCRVVLRICGQMIKAANDQRTLSLRQVVGWSERIESMLTKPSVFLEMNRKYFLCGHSLKWQPPK